ncbi:MAG: hypothetical protein HYT30_02695 [Parcubacteria group bacterium]|nr:hypothetical protein [Parcubacteria group bacterium]
MDSISIAGATSSSASYLLQDTISQSASGTSTSASYIITAGYQAMRVDETLSVTLPGTITMSTVNIDKGGMGTTTATWTISSNGGYQFYVKANSNPTMQPVDGVGTISEAEIQGFAGNGPGDWEFNNSVIAAEFAYQPASADLMSDFAGLACGNFSNECYVRFSTSNRLIASRSAASTNRTVTLGFALDVSPLAALTEDMEGNWRAVLTVSIIGL